MAFRNLSARITGDSTDYVSATELAKQAASSFGSEAISLSGKLQVLQGRADEAGDEIADVGRESAEATGGLFSLGSAAGAASGGMATFGLSTEGAGFAVRGLSGSILLSLIPALTVLGATLVPIVAALGGFVSIAGAVAGLGLIGTLGAIAHDTQLLKRAFKALVEETMTALAPAFQMASEVLFVFINEFRQIIPQLLPAKDTLQTLGGAFADLGAIIIQNIPAFLQLATTLTTRFLPPFNVWLRDILPRLPGMIMRLVSAFDRMLPRFMEAGRLLMDMAPPLLEFGFAALRVVGPALADLAMFATQVFTEFNALNAGTQNLITQASLLAPVLTTVISLLGGISAPVLAVVAAVGLLWQAWNTNFGNIRGVVQSTWQDLQRVLGRHLPTLIKNTRTILNTILPVLEPIFNVLLRVAGTQLVQTFDVLLSLLTAASQVLVGDFGGAWKTVNGLMKRTLGRIRDIINLLTGGAFNDAMNFLGSVGQSISIDSGSTATSRGPPGPRATAAGATGSREVRVVLDERTDVVDSRIESGAENVVIRRERRSDRNRERGPF